MRKFVCLLGLVFLFSLSASAQGNGSKIEIFAGYSFVHTQPDAQLSSFNTNGCVAPAAMNFSSRFSGLEPSPSVRFQGQLFHWLCRA